VYWMALAAIPTSILEKIRKLMFSFLWSGDEGKKYFHLCSWEVIARPKLLGGWGIRNIYLFNYALATNSLWCVLMKEGVWNKVIKDKYIPHSSVVTWLRSTPTTAPSASQTVRTTDVAGPYADTWQVSYRTRGGSRECHVSGRFGTFGMQLGQSQSDTCHHWKGDTWQGDVSS
jgi:hypothetical protein